MKLGSLLFQSIDLSKSSDLCIRFYEKNGWKNMGPRPGHPEVNFMEKALN